MDISVPKISDIPVSTFVGISIIIIFCLYTVNILKYIPCGKDFVSVFSANFIHIESYHFMSNLYALYALSRVEKELGAKKFFTLLIFLLIFNTIIEVVIHKLIPTIPCSIGLSGVLFGIMTYEIISKNELDFFIITSIIATVAMPSIMSRRVSLLAHSIGAFSGIIGGLLYKKIVFK
jgi:membrane associated rhomboid family serine protease